MLYVVKSMYVRSMYEVVVIRANLTDLEISLCLGRLNSLPIQYVLIFSNLTDRHPETDAKILPALILSVLPRSLRYVVNDLLRDPLTNGHRSIMSSDVTLLGM
jgi:hypothetical protein